MPWALRTVPSVGWGTPGLVRTGERACGHRTRGSLGPQPMCSLPPAELGQTPDSPRADSLCCLPGAGEASLLSLLTIYLIGILFSGHLFWRGGRTWYVSPGFLGSGLGLLLRWGLPLTFLHPLSSSLAVLSSVAPLEWGC